LRTGFEEAGDRKDVSFKELLDSFKEFLDSFTSFLSIVNCDRLFGEVGLWSSFSSFLKSKTIGSRLLPISKCRVHEEFGDNDLSPESLDLLTAGFFGTAAKNVGLSELIDF
jgi:hypothetical protein